jgi:D-alanyl-D-alanine dipeptidase
MTTVQPGFVQFNAAEIGLPLYLRYSGEHNFVGRPINGYCAADLLILTKEAASALFKVQEELNNIGYSLAVYDAYRPTKAVDDFVEWAKNISDIKNKEIFYPNVDKSNLFTDGYIAEKSGHSRGSTVDVSIIKLNISFWIISKSSIIILYLCFDNIRINLLFLNI